MSRVPQQPASKGSQKWLQVLVNDRPDLINARLSQVLGLESDERINWLSPLRGDHFAEYRDEAFLKRLGVTLDRYPLAKFWPKRGPQWDGLAKTDRGSVILVEAKAHLNEMVSSPSGASPGSLARIKRSLLETKTFLRSKTPADWSQTLYQYTNRLAHLYLLRQLNLVPAYLVFLYFVNDSAMNGPRTSDYWRAAITLAKGILGVQEQRLSRYVVDVFLEVQDLHTVP